MVAFPGPNQQPLLPENGKELVPSHLQAPELLLQEVVELAGAQARHFQAQLLDQRHDLLLKRVQVAAPVLALVMGLPATAKQSAGQGKAYFFLFPELMDCLAEGFFRI